MIHLTPEQTALLKRLIDAGDSGLDAAQVRLTQGGDLAKLIQDGLATSTGLSIFPTMKGRAFQTRTAA